MPALTSSPTEEDLEAILWREAAKVSFVAFLRFVRIEATVEKFGQVVGEDAAIAMELWPHLVERARRWEAGDDEVILKARQLGISWLLAAFALWKGMQPASRVLLLSKDQDAAFELLRKVEFIFMRLPQELQKPLEVDNKGELNFDGGGAIKALPSTKNAGRSFTARLVIADEAAFHEWAQENFKAYRATVADGGQLLIASTANGVGGFFYDRYWAAKEYNELLADLEEGLVTHPEDSPVFRAALRAQARAVFIPWFARPDRDEAWLARERMQYPGLPDEFRQEYPATDREAFVQLTGLVYPQFDPERHILSFEPVPWTQCLARFASYDVGGGDPTAVVCLGVWRRPDGTYGVHQYGYWRKETGPPTADEMGAFLLAWHAHAPFMEIEPDPIDNTMAASLRAMGLPVVASGRYTRQEGLGIQAWFLDNDFLTIGAHCKPGIREFQGYRWATRTDPNSKDRYKTGTPHDHHGDEMDARRNALTTIYYHWLSGGHMAQELPPMRVAV